ncbi:MAG TPA: hypothetical protein VFQ82_00920 [Stellaceae bacterium]|jgi:hypothetical protein|nr:hypothetical protein [Stellaceae bacterium]
MASSPTNRVFLSPLARRANRLREPKGYLSPRLSALVIVMASLLLWAMAVALIYELIAFI